MPERMPSAITSSPSGAPILPEVVEKAERDHGAANHAVIGVVAGDEEVLIESTDAGAVANGDNPFRDAIAKGTPTAIQGKDGMYMITGARVLDDGSGNKTLVVKGRKLPDNPEA